MLFAVPRAASAEWYLTPMAGITFHGNTTLLDLEHAADKVHLQLGGAATLVGSGLFGVEGITVLTPSFFRDGEPSLLELGRSFALMGNAVVTLPQHMTEYSLRPFVSGGFGLLRATQSGLLPLTTNLTGYNIGFGAVGFLSPRTGIRFDLRYYSSLRRPEQDDAVPALGRVHLSYVTASVGLVLRRK